jgi:uncharacterized membrane protein
LLLSTGLVTVSILLYYRSLQVGSISVIAPLFGFTPLFMLGTGYLFFHDLPSARVIAGVLLILLGSLQAHWKSTMRTATTAVIAFLREKGVGTVLTACLPLSVTNLLDKWLVTHTDALSYAWLYSVMCALFTSCLLLILGTGAFFPGGKSRSRILVASLLDTTVLLLYFASLQYIDAVVTVATKRSGIVLSVIAGSFFFGERNARQRLAAACVRSLLSSRLESTIFASGMRQSYHAPRQKMLKTTGQRSTQPQVIAELIQGGSMFHYSVGKDRKAVTHWMCGVVNWARTARLCFLFVALLLTFTTTTQAQTGQGAIAGNVTDTSGAVVRNATVQVTNDETLVFLSTTTNSAGAYNVQSLDPGGYTVTVTMQGFEKEVVHGVTVGAAQQPTINVALRICNTRLADGCLRR